ncbi:hypothetical protein ECZU08_48430 [Escherichia coli]|nr:hypothetical protein ECZU08_48430 [Escherichia coli]
MSGARLHTLLPELTTRQPVMVVGAAVIDVIADAYALPAWVRYRTETAER